MVNAYAEVNIPVPELISVEIPGWQTRDVVFRNSVIFVLLFCAVNTLLLGCFLFLTLSSIFYRVITIFLFLILFSNMSAKLSLLLISGGNYENDN